MVETQRTTGSSPTAGVAPEGVAVKADEMIKAAEAILQESLEIVSHLERRDRYHDRSHAMAAGMGVASRVGAVIGVEWPSPLAGDPGLDQRKLPRLARTVRKSDLLQLPDRIHSAARWVKRGVVAAMQSVQTADVGFDIEDRERTGVMLDTADGEMLDCANVPSVHEVVPKRTSGGAGDTPEQVATEITLTVSMPVASGRQGNILAEGAAVLGLKTLEHPLAREEQVVREGNRADSTVGSYSLRSNNPEGIPAARSVALAVQNVGLHPTDVRVVIARGCGTPTRGRTETLAIKSFLHKSANTVPVLASGSMIGHTFGAMDRLGSVAGLVSIRCRAAPPTTSVLRPDSECHLDYVPNETQSVAKWNVLLNSFGFGGNNACLVFSRDEHAV